MPEHHEWYVGSYHHFGGPIWLPLLFTGMSLIWLVAPIVIATAYLWWRERRPAIARQPLGQSVLADDPSAFELLRRRYVVGEIDAPTFEEMTERLLVSEHMERQRQPSLARDDHYDRYLRRERQEREPRPVLL